jgi:exopolysaccharide production protein ExoZ
MEDPTPASGKPTTQLAGIQYLRAIAALMVVYFHLVDELPEYTRYLTSGSSVIDFDRLRTGVDIFFVISGFIMVVTSRRSAPGEFLVRRAMRIIPLYWILTLLLVLPAIALPAMLHSTHPPTAGQIVKSLLFVPFSNPDHSGELWPILVPGWTLNMEMYFYAIFAILLTAPFRERQIASAVGIFALLATLHYWCSDSLSLGWFYTQPKLLEFLAGMLLGYAFQAGSAKLPRSVSVALIASGFALLLCHAPWGKNSLLSDGLPAVMIVWGAICLEKADALPQWPWFKALGDASYSIYLTHIFTLWIMRAAWPHVWHFPAGPVGALAFGIAVLAAVICGALLSYRLIEKRSLQILRGLWRRPFQLSLDWRREQTDRSAGR